MLKNEQIMPDAPGQIRATARQQHQPVLCVRVQVRASSAAAVGDQGSAVDWKACSIVFCICR
jgi:hypothetical protein